MIIRLHPHADPAAVSARLAALGLWVERYEADGAAAPGSAAPLFVVHPWSSRAEPDAVAAIDGVDAVLVPPSPTPRLDALAAPVEVAGVRFGPGHRPVLMAGPCSVESEAQIDALAAQLARLGARFLRGGAFKPRTSPYAFRGHGAPALAWLSAAARAHGLGVVSEALGESSVERVAEHADLIQIGSRNMQNFALLRAAGATGRPILLKRGMAATLDEWRLAAEHCLDAGAPAVIFCERGIRSFDPHTRNVLDLGAVALLAGVYGHAVVVDPSHAAGRRDLVLPLARAALAAGACGLLVETHPDPGRALSDGPQAVDPAALAQLAAEIDAGAPASGRR
jgi:3-deoxy-7-phosphoheptulonate synthase